MSVENVENFYAAISQDETVKQRFNELNQKYQGVAMNAAKTGSVKNFAHICGWGPA